MLFVKPLSVDELISLESMLNNHPFRMNRLRAAVILASNKGYPVQEIAYMHNICRQSAAAWINLWENNGIASLFDRPRSGRPHKLPENIEEAVIKAVEEEPRSLKKALAKLKAMFNMKNVSISTIKRICKRAGLSWKRIRKSLKSKRNKDEYEKTVKMLEELIEKDLKDEIDLYYFDESGFNLEPCVPYAWQLVNEHIEVPSSASKRLNVLGFMNRDCDFESFVFEGGVNSSAVAACFDAFSKTIKKDTYVLVDNASMHTSNEFKEQIEKWTKKGLFVVFNAPYSPELNIIEILWRKIKYEWMPLSAYNSYDDLKDELFNILKNIGYKNEYIIEFS